MTAYPNGVTPTPDVDKRFRELLRQAASEWVDLHPEDRDPDVASSERPFLIEAEKALVWVLRHVVPSYAAGAWPE